MSDHTDAVQTGDPPPLAIGIAAFNRAGLPRATLDSLAWQTLDRSAFEVVVDDDGSSDGTWDVVRLFSGPLRVTYGCQRNAGIVNDAKAVSTVARALTFDDFCHRVRQGRSNCVFSRLHPGRAVQDWAEVATPDEAWARVEPVFDTVVLAARDVNGRARLKAEFGFSLDESERALLCEAYGTAFRAAKLKGIHEGSVAAA